MEINFANEDRVESQQGLRGARNLAPSDWFAIEEEGDSAVLVIGKGIVMPCR